MGMDRVSGLPYRRCCNVLHQGRSAQRRNGRMVGSQPTRTSTTARSRVGTQSASGPPRAIAPTVPSWIIFADNILSESIEKRLLRTLEEDLPAKRVALLKSVEGPSRQPPPVPLCGVNLAALFRDTSGKVPGGLRLTPCGGYFVYPLGSILVIRSIAGKNKQSFFEGHTSDISCVAMSVDGSRLVSGQVCCFPPACLSRNREKHRREKKTLLSRFARSLPSTLTRGLLREPQCPWSCRAPWVGGTVQTNHMGVKADICVWDMHKAQASCDAGQSSCTNVLIHRLRQHRGHVQALDFRYGNLQLSPPRFVLPCWKRLEPRRDPHISCR